jgi:hypothetical protein
MPVATDLVTDLPADFEVFGQAVATSMADLLGGTSGQVLAKNSNTDMDFVWVAQDDSNAIQNAIVDAKGDLIAATAADTPARLAVGTNGQYLQADSTQATGLKWATASASAFVGCSLKKISGAQTVADSTFVAVTFNAENFDTDAFHDNTTNASRITIPAGKAGKYLFTWNTGLITGVSLSYLFVNGTGGNRYVYLPVASTYQSVASSILNLSVADYVEIYFRQTTGSTQTIYDETNGATGIANFSCQYLGA